MHNAAPFCAAGGGAANDTYMMNNDLYGEGAGAAIVINWAQQTSSGASLNLLTGSYLSITRIK
jgi:hypothetical protein